MAWSSERDTTGGLSGQRVLVVDDEAIIALDVESIVTAARNSEGSSQIRPKEGAWSDLPENAGGRRAREELEFGLLIRSHGLAPHNATRQ